MNMQPLNKMRTEFLSKSSNEAFARVVAAAFAAQQDPSIDILADIRTAVSEAVTNAIVHGYGDREGIVVMECTLYPDYIEILVEDFGKGIEDIEKAKTPLFTTRPDLERSGMGFTVMETFMDELEVASNTGEGTKIRMKKFFGNR
jgi:stage II sporulation protein AB (anti-sigma F factor)